MTTSQRLMRLPLMLAVAVCLLIGMLAGLARLGVVLPGMPTGAVANHGPLMIGGVLGALICLERAVALSVFGKRYVAAYAAPFLAGAGGILLALGVSGDAPKLLITAGSAGLVAIFALLLRMHPVSYIGVMTVGGVCWLAGNLLWLSGQPVYNVVHGWAAFLILTVVGERLELSRIQRLTGRSQQLFLLAAGVYIAGVALTLFALDAGVRLAGVGQVALAAWLLHYDIARQTIRRTGLPRFAAACLLAGYVWLGIGGVFGLTFGGVLAGIQYEALLHALLLGFIFSMIFGHALIIIPAITGRQIAFRTVLYLPLVLLHASLVLRVASALSLQFTLRSWAATLNITAILLFFGLVALGARSRQMSPDVASEQARSSA